MWQTGRWIVAPVAAVILWLVGYRWASGLVAGNSLMDFRLDDFLLHWVVALAVPALCAGLVCGGLVVLERDHRAAEGWGATWDGVLPVLAPMAVLAVGPLGLLLVPGYADWNEMPVFFVLGLGVLVAPFALDLLGLSVARRTRSQVGRTGAHPCAAGPTAHRQALASWQGAHRLGQDLMHGRATASVQADGMGLPPGESVLADTGAWFSCPARGKEGIAEAPTAGTGPDPPDPGRWEPYRPVRLVLTDRRVLCGTGGEWIDLPLAYLQAARPLLVDWQVTGEFAGLGPVAVAGPVAPMVAVTWVAALAGPESLPCDPGTARLFAPAPPPRRPAGLEDGSRHGPSTDGLPLPPTDVARWGPDAYDLWR